jgi:hypothetical protein
MGLSITGRKAATRVMAARYARATKAEKGAILDELCSLTGWTPPRPQGHLRRRARASSSGEARPVVYDPEVMDALRKVWIVMGGPCGKRLALFLSGIVTALERHCELSLHPEVRA